MPRPLVILGSSGHAKMVIEAVRSRDDFQPKLCLAGSVDNAQSVLGVPVAIESQAILEQLRRDGYWAFVAIGQNRIRRKLQQQLESLQFPMATIIAAGAWLSPSATVGAGTILMPNSTVGAEVQLGRGVILNTNASVDHDCLIDNYVHIGPGSHLAGNVTVESEAFCGVGTSVIPNQRIGASATVGAGGVVVCNIPADETWIGCPARPMAGRLSAARQHAA